MGDVNLMAISSILDNLDITFTNCIFLYARLDNLTKAEIPQDTPAPVQENGIVRSEIRESIRKNKAAKEKLKVSTCGLINSRYEKCEFSQGDGQDVIEKHLAAQDVDKMKLQFVNCQFIRKTSNLPSNVVRRVKRWFGTKFALDYITVTAEITDGKFKMKDIPEIIEVIVKKIQHTHFNEKRILDTSSGPVKFHFRY